MKRLPLILAAVCLGGCTAPEHTPRSSLFQTPSRGFIYREACRAAAASPGFPPDATFLPLEQARVGLGKNAALVDVPFRSGDAAPVRWSTVRFKRVARTWVAEEVSDTPVYPPPAPAAAAAAALEGNAGG